MKVPSVGLPFWGRVLLLVGVCGLALGGGLLAYRYVERPTILTLATGPIDGDAGKAAAIVAQHFAARKSPIRLDLETFGSVVEAGQAFAAGKADLAVVRADIGNVPDARSVAIMAKGVAMLIAPPGSKIAGVGDLRGLTVGVVGGAANRTLVDVLSRQYGLADAKVTFKDIAMADARRAVETRDVAVLLLVVPLTDKYLSFVRSIFPTGAPVLIPIDAAGAIADADGAYESFDIPKAALRGAPAVPDDDVTTLRVGYYLVANKRLDADVVARLTQMIVAARRDLIVGHPQLAGIAAADTDADAYIPIHPGAAAYYNGTEQSFMDKYGDDIYLAPMILGGLASLFAAAWRFLGIRPPDDRALTLQALHALPKRIRSAQDEADLASIELEIDQMLGAQLAKVTRDDEDALEVTTLFAAVQRLDNLIHHRRSALTIESKPPLGAAGRV